MAQTSSLYALIVSINEYPIAHHRLQGCVNDGKAIAAFLEERYEPGQLHLRTLFDKDATRENVADAFLQHFKQAQNGDTCLFYFSGHGSQSAAPKEFLHLEPDGLLESIVCWDSRIQGGRDLMDKELSYLIWAAQEGKDVHFVSLFDCCHSGSNTRGEGVRARMAEPSQMPTELTRFVGNTHYKLVPQASGAVAASPPRANHINIAAARADETAKEMRINGIPRGIFTYQLLRLLEDQSSPLTYNQIVESLRVRISDAVEKQTPQIETPDGWANEPFLRMGSYATKPYYTLNFRQKAKQWVINAGQLQGLPAATPDAVKMSVFADGRDVPLLVQKIDVTESVVIPAENLDLDKTYRARLDYLPVARHRLALAADADPQVKKWLPKLLDDLGGSPYLELVDDPKNADLLLRTLNGRLRLTLPGDDRPVVRQLEGFTEENVSILLNDAFAIAQWHYVLGIRNAKTAITEKDFAIDWYRVDKAGEWDDTAPATRIEHWQEPQLFSYEFNPGGAGEDPWRAPAFRLRVRNTSQRTLYFSALAITSDFRVSNSLMQSQQLEPGQEAWVMDRPEGENMAYNTIPLLFNEAFIAQNLTEVHEYVKVFVSTTDFNTNDFNQAPLEMENPRLEAKKRMGRRPQTQPAGHDWRTVELSFRVVRPLLEVAVQGGQAATVAGDVQLELPAGVSAKAVLQSPDQLERGLGDTAPTPSAPGWLPYGLTTGQVGSPPLSVLELKNPSGAENMSADQPGYISLPRQRALSDEVILPLAYDTETGLYYPIGAMEEDGRIRLDALPEPTPDAERSLGGSIKIFFVKTLNKYIGIDYNYPQLAIAELEEAEAGQAAGIKISYNTDTEAIRQRIAAAQRIVLYTHGIIGDTLEMPKIMKLVRDTAGHELAEHYDLALTFDYENLNTPIEETAKLLKKRLEEVGLGAGHGKLVHVVAHSMGGLVSRWFIEKEGGNQVVSHLFQVGTPNAGSPYGSVYEMVSVFMTAAVNKATFLTPYMIPINFLLKAVDQMVATLKQMKPDSEFYTQLNDGSDPGIPYTVIAGNTKLIPFALEERHKKLLQKAVARFRKRGHYDALTLLLFKSANDIAASVDSINGIPGTEAWAHRPNFITTACDHISYFAEPAGLQALQEALLKPAAVV